MRVIVDGFGGDNAPLSVCEGSVMAVKELGVKITIVGDTKKLRSVFSEKGLSEDGIEFADAPDVMGMEDEPTEIIKSKKNSSMAVGLTMVKDGAGDAFVSAGSTGALLVGATLLVKRIRGVKRAALAPIIPSIECNYMLIDCGANVECRPEMLVQFGVMGSVYMKRMMNVASPRVGLLNIGTERTKGSPLQVESYPLFEAAPFNFVGNAEARDVPFGGFDVVVADGFSGNIVLKMTEGLSSALLGQIKGIFKRNLLTKIGAATVLGPMKEFKKKMDYTEVGGAPLMGIAAPVIKAHGSSSGKAFYNAIRQAAAYAESGMIGEIEATLNTPEAAK